MFVCERDTFTLLPSHTHNHAKIPPTHTHTFLSHKASHTLRQTNSPHLLVLSPGASLAPLHTPAHLACILRSTHEKKFLSSSGLWRGWWWWGELGRVQAKSMAPRWVSLELEERIGVSSFSE